MFPVHGASSPPLALPDMRGSTQPASPACSNANNSRNKQSRWPWLKAGGRLIGTGSALPGPAQAVARGAGVVGVAYASLWLLLLGYRTVKKQLLRKALREIVPALEKAGVTFWLDFGTLMSISRNNDVYEHDNDVDLVVLNPDFPQLIEQLRQPGVLPKGYTVDWIGKNRDIGDGLRQRWVRVYLPGKVMWADLFGAWDFGDKLRINKNAHCDLPKHMVLPLSRTLMLDASGPAPRDVEGVLQHRYGPDWRTPKYAAKGRDKVEHNKRYLKVLRGLGRIGLKL